MQKRIRILALFMVGLFGIVLLQALNIQFFKSSALSNSSGNPRIANALRNQPRGEILAADGTILAQSIPSTSSIFKYQRVYPQQSLYSQEVGFNSPVYGAYGLEASYNSYLTVHSQPAQSLAQLFSPVKEPDSLTLTLVPYTSTDNSVSWKCRAVGSVAVPGAGVLMGTGSATVAVNAVGTIPANYAPSECRV